MPNAFSKGLRAWIALFAAVGFVSCGDTDESSGAAGFPGGGFAGAGAAGQTTLCSPARCPVAPDAEACCVTLEGPCGLLRDNVCQTDSFRPPADAGDEGPAALTCESARVPPVGTFCPHAEKCREACNSVDEPCQSLSAFEKHCMERCCEATRDMERSCADCVIAGISAEYLCNDTCACDVAFLSSSSAVCSDACQSRALAPCGSDDACGSGSSACTTVCGSLALCADPGLPACSCTGSTGSACPDGSTCLCACGPIGLCATPESRRALCAQPFSECFNCPDEVPDAGPDPDAAPLDGATDVAPGDGGDGGDGDEGDGGLPGDARAAD